MRFCCWCAFQIIDETQWIYTVGEVTGLGLELVLEWDTPFTAVVWSQESTADMRASVLESWIEQSCWSNSTTNWIADVSCVAAVPVDVY